SRRAGTRTPSRRAKPAPPHAAAGPVRLLVPEGGLAPEARAESAAIGGGGGDGGRGGGRRDRLGERKRAHAERDVHDGGRPQTHADADVLDQEQSREGRAHDRPERIQAI